MNYDPDRTLCIISDTHNQHKQILIPGCWALIHCGDHSFTGTENEFLQFIEWFKHCPAKHKIMISGNHDWFCQRNTRTVRTIAANAGVHYLQDEAIILDGIKFYGSPWQPYFGAWAFNFRGSQEQNQGLYEQDARACWAKIPDNTDVLITHGPPKNILDEVQGRYRRKNPEHCFVGCQYLRDTVLEVEPLVHAYGHIHEGYGQTQIFGKQTIFVNAAQLDGEYRATNKPHVLELHELFDIQDRSLTVPSALDILDTVTANKE